MSLSGKTVEVWAGILVVLAALLVLEMFAMDFGLFGMVAGNVHSVVLAVIGVTLILEANQGGFSRKKAADVFILTVGIIALLVALSVFGLYSIPSIIAPYLAIFYILFVVAMVAAVKWE